MKSRFLELIPDFQKEIESFKMTSRLLELISDFQNDIEIKCYFCVVPWLIWATYCLFPKISESKMENR